MFNAKIRTKDKNKLYVNKLIQEVGELRNRNNGEALILDSECLLTTNHLVKAGFKKNSIFIPNPFVFNKIKKKHDNTYNMLLSEFIERYKFKDMKGKISLAFFDYMTTLDGNLKQDIYPKQDIENYFKYKYPSNDSIFAITISLRNGKKSKGVCSDVNILDFYITKNAYENGYQAIKLPEGYGYNSMMFEVWRLIKHPSVQH